MDIIRIDLKLQFVLFYPLLYKKNNTLIGPNKPYSLTLTFFKNYTNFNLINSREAKHYWDHIIS